jgi:hypothetical protein
MPPARGTQTWNNGRAVDFLGSKNVTIRPETRAKARVAAGPLDRRAPVPSWGATREVDSLQNAPERTELARAYSKRALQNVHKSAGLALPHRSRSRNVARSAGRRGRGRCANFASFARKTMRIRSESSESRAQLRGTAALANKWSTWKHSLQFARFVGQIRVSRFGSGFVGRCASIVAPMAGCTLRLDRRFYSETSLQNVRNAAQLLSPKAQSIARAALCGEPAMRSRRAVRAVTLGSRCKMCKIQPCFARRWRGPGRLQPQLRATAAHEVPIYEPALPAYW